MNLSNVFISLLHSFFISKTVAGGDKHVPGSGYGEPIREPIRHDDSFVPDHVLVVTYENISIGCQTRPSVVINGTSPGPEIRLKAGKTSWIRVYNHMTHEDHCHNTTIHWHGLSQRTAMFSDGAPVTQWPIPCGYFFDYEVHPFVEDAGTYFLHSHIGFQAVSATAALIVEDEGEPPYAYDEERVILFTDYYNKTDTQVETGLTSNPFVWSGETNAVLINGVGVAIGETAGSYGCELPVIHVEPEKTYRFRFIGATAISMVQFAIVGHPNFTIIGADGHYTLPYEESYMQLSSGQRFEVLFRTKSASELGNQTDFLIQYETKDRPSVYHGYGVLRYSNATASITKAPATPPLTLSNATYNWLEYALQPLYPNDFPRAEEVTRRVTIDVRQLTTNTIIWAQNGNQWNDSTLYGVYPGGTPYLVEIYEKGQAAIPDYQTALNNSGWVSSEACQAPFRETRMLTLKYRIRRLICGQQSLERCLRSSG
jgi:L-ascorbate oxidase